MPRREQKEQRSDPEDRIRAILGVADDEPMPRVGLHSLRKYHAHLAARLVFPFAGKLNSPVGPHRDTRSPLSVVRLTCTAKPSTCANNTPTSTIRLR